MMLQKILTYLYPQKCIFCGQILSSEASMEACSFCFDMLDLHQSVQPKKDFYPSSYCDGVFCIANYEGLMRKAILQYKFFEKEWHYRFFAQLFVLRTKDYFKSHPLDGILAVPLHPKRLKQRGYNQAELISKEIANFLEIKDFSSHLKRVLNTPKQSLLKKEERKKNLQNAFFVEDIEKIQLKNLLVIDDILTTGETLEGCARVLKQAGANRVLAGVLASTR
jgi:competence protein ComFC